MQGPGYKVDETHRRPPMPRVLGLEEASPAPPYAGCQAFPTAVVRGSRASGSVGMGVGGQWKRGAGN